MHNILQTAKLLELKEKHSYHLVEPSQLPLLTSLSATLLFLNIVFYLHPAAERYLNVVDGIYFHLSWVLFIITLCTWFYTVVKESKEGYHTLAVRLGLRSGMLLFIVSEVMFFFAFFWAFFHGSLSPSIAIGSIWPPKSIQALDIWGLPLVNTLLLLSSGVTITLAHRAILQSTSSRSRSKFNKHLFVTILLGIIFLSCQGIEYKYGITFHWKENIYGSTFFTTTGFHGLHVTVGTIFLLFCLLRNIPPLASSLSRFLNQKRINALTLYLTLKKKLPKNYISTQKVIEFLSPFLMQIDQWVEYILKRIISAQARYTQIWIQYALQKDQHVGFEAAAWYWHFVDVVWIFLFVTVYWWGT